MLKQLTFIMLMILLETCTLIVFSTLNYFLSPLLDRTLKGGCDREGILLSRKGESRPSWICLQQIIITTY